MMICRWFEPSVVIVFQLVGVIREDDACSSQVCYLSVSQDILHQILSGEVLPKKTLILSSKKNASSFLKMRSNSNID